MDTQVHFMKPAAAIFYGLSEEEKKKSNELIELAATDIKSPTLSGNLRQLSTLGKHVYSLNPNSKPAIIFEITKTNVKICDILNLDLLGLYFNKAGK